jgi:GT2 family glycosyltransferase
MKVHLAIPNYNGVSNIENILDKALTFDFEKIYVLDDCSNDDSLKILKKYEKKIEVVKGDRNLGPGGNRNRILDIWEGDNDDIIQFLDVDSDIQSVDLESMIKYFQDNRNNAVVGGKILTLKDEPMWWNYGYEMHPVKSAAEKAYMDVAERNWDDDGFISKMREYVKEYSFNLEIKYPETSDFEVDWVSGENFAIRYSVFKQVNGFDLNMRYHEEQDLCKRVRDSGYKVVYNPFIVVKHLDMNTFGEDREKIARENAYYFYQKHWGMNRKIFDKLFPYEG